MSLGDRAAASAIALGVSLLLFPASVRAQSAEAEALFRDGRALIKRGQLAAGCDKLAASERLESSVGTLLNLGDCREKQGKLATAWAAFRKAEAMAKRAGSDERRQAEAGRRAAALEPKLPGLVIEVARPVDGLTVRRDAELVDAAQWSTTLPVDPGSYTIVAEAPGYQPWRTTVAVAATTRRQLVSVPQLARTPVASLPDAPAAEPVAPPTIAAPVRTRETWSATRKVSVGLAVLGAGAVGTGVYFGLHSNDLRDRADARCPQSACSDADGLRLNDDAQTAATRANIAFVAGCALVAGAAVLWLVGAPGETVIAPTASERHVGVAMMGSF